MSSELITNLVQEYRDFIFLLFGIFILVGAIKNWNWLCNPIGKPDSHLYGWKARRVIFFLLGIVLILVSILDFIL